MATSVDVLPSLGAGLVASQTGPSGGYNAIDLRRGSNIGLQEGVLAAGSLEVTQRAAGANLSVDVAANVADTATGATALVQGDSITAQGLYSVAPHTAAINLDVAAANATNPRVDIVVLECKDDQHDVSGLNVARVRIISGTATSGATLDNRTGAAATPSSCLLLADVHVPATDTTIANSQIRDRRKWARGAYCRLVRTAGNYTTTLLALTAIDLTNFNPRLEFSGVPVVISLFGQVQHSVAANMGLFGVNLDGTGIDGTATIQRVPMAVTGTDYPVALRYVSVPAAGSHLIAPTWGSSATATLAGTASAPLVFAVEEVIRQNSKNNITTTG